MANFDVICGSNKANTPAILTSNGSVMSAIAAGDFRTGLIIQNLGTQPLFVRFQADASASLFHVVLKGGSANDDGLGASLVLTSGVVPQGVVSVYSAGPRFVVTEFK
jgi:hypothetical protein